MATDRFSRRLRPVNQGKQRSTLIPDANFSRNVSFHVVLSPEGDQTWVGRYLYDLIELLGESHPEGVLVDIDGIEYLLTVAPAPKG